jgi:hypothetical protein
VKSDESAVLATPPVPVSVICGKYAAVATPIWAFAATICAEDDATVVLVNYHVPEFPADLG